MVLTYETIDDVMDAYVETAKDYLSYSHSQKEDDEEAKYIIEHYDGSADEYALDDASIIEYFDERLAYAFDETFRSIPQLDYHYIVESASKLNNDEIDSIIEDIEITPVTKDTGIEFLDYVSNEEKKYQNAVSQIMDVLAPEYNAELGEYFVNFLQSHVDDYIRRNN